MYQQMPSHDPNDPHYRRLRYIRYADDFLLGFVGPRAEAKEIKRGLANFLRDTLKLELSEGKTLITHAKSQQARFLGYDISVFHNDTKRDDKRRRSINGRIRLRIPVEVIRKKCSLYMEKGKPAKRAERQLNSVFSTVTQYQSEYRGVVEYYRMAHNLYALGRLKWVMRTSLLKTLAGKLHSTASQVARRYSAILQTPDGPRKGLRVTVERKDGKKPLTAIWGGISLKRDPHAVLSDQPSHIWNVGTELVQRLLADTCELCGSHDNVEVHHIHAISMR